MGEVEKGLVREMIVKIHQKPEAKSRVEVVIIRADNAKDALALLAQAMRENKE